MTKNELTDKVGKKFLFSENTLAAKLSYDSGISQFDDYLDGKTLNQIGAVIHLTKYPKGLVIKIAKHFSSFKFGLPYSEIERTILTEKSGVLKLIFETSSSDKIIFSLKNSDISEVKQFIDDFNIKYASDINNQDSNPAFSKNNTNFKIKVPGINTENKNSNELEKTQSLDDASKWKAARWGVIVFCVIHYFFEISMGKIELAIVPVLVNFWISAKYIKWQISKGKDAHNPFLTGLSVSGVVFLIRLVLYLAFTLMIVN